jgi:hypothetical protein
LVRPYSKANLATLYSCAGGDGGKALFATKYGKATGGGARARQTSYENTQVRDVLGYTP